jgi:hypothetical protein
MAHPRALALVMALGAVVTGLNFSAQVNAAPDPEERSLIQRLCLAGFQSAFAQAGKLPPEGMGNFTCSCLVQRLHEGESLGPARESCKLEASRRFPLPKG